MAGHSDSSSGAPPLNPIAAGLAPSLTVKIWQRGFGREGVIPLYVGEGDLPTPEFIVAAAERALEAGQTFYSPSPTKNHITGLRISSLCRPDRWPSSL